MKRVTFATMSALFFCFNTGAGNVQADDTTNTGNNIFTLGEIVVEDSSGVQDIAITNVITEEEIEAVGAVTAGEALKYVPGVNLVQTTKGEQNINIQGFSQKDILVLIDGVPYYETKNGPLDLQQIPAGIIGKIEVTKGASSVLYGPNAMGGVVNIITKQGVEGFTGSVSTEFGDGAYNRDVATINYGHESGFSVLASIDYRTRDSLDFSNDYVPNATRIKGMGRGTYIIDDGGSKANSDLESLNLWTRLGYAPTEKVEVYASVYRFELERGRLFSDSYNKSFSEDLRDPANPRAAFSTFGRYDSYEDMGVDFGGKVDVNDWLTFRAMAFYHSHEDDYVSYEDWTLENSMAVSTWDDDSYGVSLFTDMDLEKVGNLSFSAQYRRDKHRQRGDVDYDWEDSESDIFTLAVEDTLKFGSFTVVAGLAYNYYDADEIAGLPGYDTDTFDPMIGVTWTAPWGTELFGSVGKKTRFPVFADMEDDGNTFVLDPEKSINYTIGARNTLFDTIQVSVSGFYNDVSDRIAEVEDPVSGDDIMTNLDEVEIYGFEFTADSDVTDRLRMGLGYVFTHARNTSAERESDYIEDVAENQLVADMAYRIPNIETTFSVRGTLKVDNVIDDEDEIMEDSFVVDISLRKEFENGITLSGHVTNLFDKDFYEGNGMASNGRALKLVAQYNF